MRELAPLTVAISTLERPAALGRCLDAIAAGTRLPAEVVIVDQSRDDRTRTLVDGYREGPTTVVYHHQQSRGLGIAQNQAVELASHPVVAVTDDDCIVDAEWVATLEGLFRANPAPDLVAGRVLPLPPEGDRVFPVASRLSEEPREFNRRSMPWHVGSGNNFAVRRACYLRIGGCDERLGPGSPAQGGVDMDLFYRFLRAGALVRYEPAVLVHHERETWSGRRTRRPMYGRGMGACVGMRVRAGDSQAFRLLTRWVGLRFGLVGRAVWRRDARVLYEEWLMLRSTAGGLVHGLMAGGPHRGAATGGEARKSG
jgi:glycosyltransferase involved in cell wall biosynthesis